MSFEPSPKQALFLWKMIAADDPLLQKPAKSTATPKLDPKKERQPLIENGFLDTEKKGRAEHLLLTDRAWAWAGNSLNIELMRSNSRDGAIALEGLLRRLLPFFKARGIALADVFLSHSSSSPPDPNGVPGTERSPLPSSQPSSSESAHEMEIRIRDACRQLTGGRSGEPIRLAALRVALADIPQASLDGALLDLQDGGHLILYRDDNTAALTQEDHRAEILVGNAPRHLLYFKD